MSEVTIESISAAYTPIPLVDPFVLSIRSSTNANIVRWQIRCSDQKTYLGESVPVQYVTGETVESVLALVPMINDQLSGVLLRDPEQMLTSLQKMLNDYPAARAGIEIGLLNAYSTILGTSPWKMFGAAETTLTTDVTLSKVENATEIAGGYYMKGFRNFKLKVGGEKVEEDIARIKEIVRLYPDVKMRVDANQGFTAESALKFIEAMEQSKIHLEMIEQPVPKERIDQLDFIAQRSIVPIIADEACRTLQDAEMLLTQTAVQGVNVKVMKCGLYQSVEIARLAKQLDKKLMMGCMLESTVGIAAGAAIAAGVGGFDYIDLDGHFLILGNQRSDQFETVGPVLRMHTDVFPA